MSEHTKGPIHTGQFDHGSVYLWDEGEAHFIGRISAEDVGANVCKANATRLALCWNCHDELVAALKLRIEDHQCAVLCDGPHEDCPCWYCVAQSVLAKVREKGG